MPKFTTAPTRLFKVRGSNLESFFAAHSPNTNNKLTLTGMEHSIPLWLQKDTVVTESNWWQVFTSDRNAHIMIHPTEIIMQWHWITNYAGVKYLKNKRGVVEYTIVPRYLFVAHFQSVDSRQDEMVNYNAPIAASDDGFAEMARVLRRNGYAVTVREDLNKNRNMIWRKAFEQGFEKGIQHEKDRVRLEREQEDYEDSPASFDHGAIEQAEVNGDSANSDVHSKEAEDFYRESTGFLKRFRPDLLAALSIRNEDENKDAESKDSEGELAMLFSELQRKVARLIGGSK